MINQIWEKWWHITNQKQRNCHVTNQIKKLSHDQWNMLKWWHMTNQIQRNCHMTNQIWRYNAFIQWKSANLIFLVCSAQVLTPPLYSYLSNLSCECNVTIISLWPEYTIPKTHKLTLTHTQIPKTQIVDFSTTITVTAVKHSLQHHYTHVY